MTIPYTTTQYKKQYQPSQVQKQMQNYQKVRRRAVNDCRNS